MTASHVGERVDGCRAAARSAWFSGSMAFDSSMIGRAGRPGVPDRAEGRHQLVGRRAARAVRDRLVPHRGQLEQDQSTADAHAGSTGDQAARRLAQRPHPQPARRLVPIAHDSGSGGRGGDHHAAGSWTAEHVEAGRQVGDRPGQHAAGREALELDVRAGDPPPGRLEADQAAARRRDADRAATVGAVGDRAPCPAATAAAAPPEDPPGVCAGFHGLRVSPRASLSVKEIVAELRRRRLAQQHESGVDEPLTTGSDAAAGSFDARQRARGSSASRPRR